MERRKPAAYVSPYQSREGAQVWALEVGAPVDADADGQLATDRAENDLLHRHRCEVSVLELVDAPDGETLR